MMFDEEREEDERGNQEAICSRSDWPSLPSGEGGGREGLSSLNLLKGMYVMEIGPL